MLTSGLLTRRVIGTSFVGMLLLASCGDDSDTEESTTTDDTSGAAVDDCQDATDRTWIALGLSETVVPEIEVYDEPDGEVVEQIQNPWLVPIDGSETTTPPAFVVLGEDDPRDEEWLHVDLPTAPTGSQGYIRSDDVAVDCIHYRITVDREAFTLTFAHKGDAVQIGGEEAVFPVGLGRDERATEPGNYFVTELIVPTDEDGNPIPDGDYGPAAFGISGYSEDPDILDQFEDGQVGIHGTNDPGAIPGAVSSGCIRVENPNIEALTQLVPLGTPVDVV